MATGKTGQCLWDTALNTHTPALKAHTQLHSSLRGSARSGAVLHCAVPPCSSNSYLLTQSPNCTTLTHTKQLIITANMVTITETDGADTRWRFVACPVIACLCWILELLHERFLFYSQHWEENSFRITSGKGEVFCSHTHTHILSCANVQMCNVPHMHLSLWSCEQHVLPSVAFAEPRCPPPIISVTQVLEVHHQYRNDEEVRQRQSHVCVCVWEHLVPAVSNDMLC